LERVLCRSAMFRHVWEALGGLPAVSEAECKTEWELRFKQSSLHPVVRVLASRLLSGLRCLLPFQPCCCSLRLSLSGKAATQGYHAQPLPCCTGIICAVTRRTCTALHATTCNDVQRRNDATTILAGDPPGLPCHVGCPGCTQGQPRLAGPLPSRYQRNTRSNGFQVLVLLGLVACVVWEGVASKVGENVTMGSRGGSAHRLDSPTIEGPTVVVVGAVRCSCSVSTAKCHEM
jgi:hypothetical protein